MDFKEALQILNIEDYSERIWNSNSHGELFHLQSYIMMATLFKEGSYCGFRDWFESIVKHAEENWKRPESVFQHVDKILINYLK